MKTAILFKEVYVVICTRDITISEKSRLNRMSFRTPEDVSKHSVKAKEIINDILKKYNNWFIWSYETFMYLEKEYLLQLFKFLKINPNDFQFVIKEGNCKYIK
jgi:hypothetical protein